MRFSFLFNAHSAADRFFYCVLCPAQSNRGFGALERRRRDVFLVRVFAFLRLALFAVPLGIAMESCFFRIHFFCSIFVTPTRFYLDF